MLITLGQWHLQRVHNIKSVKPMGQIYFWDRDKTIAVRILNNGLGPLIIDQIMFCKSDNIYSSIVDCVDLPARSFMHDSSDDPVERVILPNSYLTVFETKFDDYEGETELNHTRNQLRPITLKVEGRDIYDNKIMLERDFKWFARYMPDNNL
ncbi:hypothetical protein WBJ53_05260 [Spirosoma sp. SC4-14]|uniref:hypothetical protein n=1 Tax=Spirosoma sp. SC4-14 TaxID=3128900 RepID=UPI0030D5F199